MKIVVVSDSHGLKDCLDDILALHSDASYFLHCGDICLDFDDMFPQFKIVCGNNDYFDSYPEEMLMEVGGHRILMLHSHRVSFYHREAHLVEKAKENNCDIVCFGHTHIAVHKIVDGIHVLNPGSLYRARDGRGPSYAILYLEGDQVRVEFIFLKN
ncbi:MAG: metallophosphoesterase family protein [Breznakia sp.]